jgi:hypothetical protein
MVTATVPLSGRPSGSALSDGTVWVADERNGTLLRVPSAHPGPGRPIEIGGHPVALTTANGPWAAVGAPGPSHHGCTLTTLPSHHAVDTIDPAASDALNISPPSLLGLTNDGLVSLNHVAGSEGSRLLPDLAVTLPLATDHGRAYTFRLRWGIRDSTGARVLATDVRHSFDRIFRSESSAAGNYIAIVRRCGLPAAAAQVRPLARHSGRRPRGHRHLPAHTTGPRLHRQARSDLRPPCCPARPPAARPARRSRTRGRT